MIDPVFIVYDNRSGSTMLSSLLDGYEQVSVSKETDFVFRVIEYKWSGQFSFGHFASYLEKTRFAELGISIAELGDELAKSTEVSQKTILNAIAGLYFKKEGQEHNALQIIKGPKIQYYINELNQMYPQAKFIHIIRDGRAVFSSKKKSISVVKFGDNYLAERTMEVNSLHAAQKWVEKARLAEKHSNTIPVRYEDLLTQTDLELKKLINFCRPGLEVLKRPEGQSFEEKKIDAAYKIVHTKVGKALEQNRIDAWKRELTKNEVLMYEWVAKDVLVAYNYPLSLLANGLGFSDRVKVYFLFIKQYIGQVLHALSYRLNMILKKITRKLRK